MSRDGNWIDVLEDPEGAPYPEEVQRMWDAICEVAVTRTTEPTRETVVAALESVRRFADNPEHTPEFVVCPECDQGKCGNCTEEVLLDDTVEDVWVECLCRHLGAPVSDTGRSR